MIYLKNTSSQILSGRILVPKNNEMKRNLEYYKDRNMELSYHNSETWSFEVDVPLELSWPFQLYLKQSSV